MDNVIQILWAFSYVLDVIKNYDVINDYMVDGGRYAAKTSQIIKGLLVVVRTTEKTNLLMVRKNETQVNGLISLVKTFLQQMGYEDWKHYKTDNTIYLGNGNQIRFVGATGETGQPKQSGFAMDNDPEYIITFVDEAYELSKKEWKGIYEGVRGLNAKTIFFRASNNWKSVSWYVRLLDKLLPFKLSKLKKYGEQIKITKNKKLIHHCNLMVNHFLQEGDRDKLINEYLEDEERGKVSLWGMPGTLEGAVYNDDSEKYSRDIPKEWGRPEELSVGIQISKKRSNVGITLNGYFNNFKNIATLKELSFSKDFEDPFISEEKRNLLIIKTIKEWYFEYRWKNEYGDWMGHDLVVAISSDETQENMSALASNLYDLMEINYPNISDFIDFTLPIRFTPEEHIDLLKTFMTSGRYICNRAAERTLTQLDAAAYGEDDKTKRDKEGFDELIKSIENALSLRRNTLLM